LLLLLLYYYYYDYYYYYATDAHDVLNAVAEEQQRITDTEYFI